MVSVRGDIPDQLDRIVQVTAILDTVYDPRRVVAAQACCGLTDEDGSTPMVTVLEGKYLAAALRLRPCKSEIQDACLGWLTKLLPGAYASRLLGKMPASPERAQVHRELARAIALPCPFGQSGKCLLTPYNPRMCRNQGAYSLPEPLGRLLKQVSRAEALWGFLPALLVVEWARDIVEQLVAQGEVADVKVSLFEQSALLDPVPT